MNTYEEKIKIAVVAPPFSGHLYPILELVLPLLNKKDNPTATVNPIINE